MPDRSSGDGNRLTSMGRGRKRPQRLGDVRWDGFTHRHMWNMVMDAHPDQVFERHREWREVGSTLIEANGTVQESLNGLFTTWRGSAAITAAMSNTDLLAWAQEAAETTQEVGEQLGLYGNALVRARMQMPQPRHTDAERAFRAGDGAEVLDGPENSYVMMQLADDNLYTSQERREAKQRAVEVMQTFERESLRVEDRVNESYTPPPFTAPAHGGSQWVEVPTNSLTPQPGPGGYPSPAPPSGVGAGVGAPAGTTAAGATPGFPVPGVNGPGGLGGYGPGGFGALPGAGSGSDSVYGGRGFGAGPLAGAGGPGGTGGAAGAMGRGMAGMAGNAAAAEAAAARGAAGAGGRGGGMMYPPMGGAGAGGDEDREKRVASFVVADDDLFDDDRPVAPPVFGA